MVDSMGKDLGQVFTPKWVVDTILDKVGYTADNPEILHQKILEPSFGEGVFFYSILDRLITAAEIAELSKEEISDLIAVNVWGLEYDDELYSTTLHSLETYLEEKAIPPVKWNLFNQDSLAFVKNNFFDYVVGNPPYIRVHNMDSEMRKNVKKFSHSSGTTDLYIIFFELGLTWLTETGKLGYITPNSYLKNTSQSAFRKELIENRLITELIDFGSSSIFTNASTYTVITLLNKSSSPTHLEYSFQDGPLFQYSTRILYSSLENSPAAPLVFGSQAEVNFLNEVKNKPSRLGDVSLAQYGVATLRDKIYTNVLLQAEEQVQRKVVKASKYKGELLTQNILFPYKEDKGMLIPLTEQELAKYPLAYKYLLENKEELLKRDLDAGANWYQYGRSQGIQGTGKKKLVFSHVISSHQKTIQVYELPEGTVVYSGMFVCENGTLTLEEIKAILESEDFCTYAKLSGKDMSGGYKTLSTKTLKEFRF